MENFLLPCFCKNLRVVGILNYRTVSANAATAKKEWLLVDASGQVLGRFASKVARLLRGKHKPNFTPHVDGGDYVIVINANKVVLTGKKWSNRVYFSHTGYPGGQKRITTAKLLEKGSDRLFKKVIRGMLPKNKLGERMIKHLYIYDKEDHTHRAQQPRTIDINTLR